jgi:hypothetical protein
MQGLRTKNVSWQSTPALAIALACARQSQPIRQAKRLLTILTDGTRLSESRSYHPTKAFWRFGSDRALAHEPFHGVCPLRQA